MKDIEFFLQIPSHFKGKQTSKAVAKQKERSVQVGHQPLFNALHHYCRYIYFVAEYILGSPCFSYLI